jgi:transcriptional regulator with XRE-family HTH domain
MKTRELIKELRLKKGITQEELAAKTDISVIGDSFDLRLLKQNTKLSFSRDKVNTLDFSSFVGLRSQGARPRIPIFR